MNKITRIAQKNIEKDLGKGKVIIVYGPRQVGKTTLVKQIYSGFKDAKYFYLGDEAYTREQFKNPTLKQLEGLVSNYKLVVIDEAQRVENIGLTLKLIVDNFPKTTVIATGSSSFDLANKVNEPLTGRFFKHNLYPISEVELIKSRQNEQDLYKDLEQKLLYGSYPEIITTTNIQDKTRIISNIANNYLFSDILAFEKIKSADVLTKLLQALALQIGNEISYTEIAQTIAVDKNTVIRYIELLEKAFVIYKLRGFSRNLRKEIGKSNKIYFNDLGIRNALINNFNPLNLRNDKGELFENYFINEYIKTNSYNHSSANYYFWRTYDQQEIDFIVDSGGKLKGYETKYNKKTFSKPKIFLNTYPNSTVELVNKDNYLDFLIK